MAYQYRVVADRDSFTFERMLMDSDADGWEVVGFSTREESLVALLRKPDAVEAPTIGDVLAEHDVDTGGSGLTP